MGIQFKHWKLSLLAVFFICVFFSLGEWQLSRAKQKKKLLQAFSARIHQSPLTIDQLNDSAQTILVNDEPDYRFYRLTVTGHFDNQHTVFLDNKIYNGQVGYEIYTPFEVTGSHLHILVDRGFVPQGLTRQQLPKIANIDKEVALIGMLSKPPAYVAFGAMFDRKDSATFRVEFIDLKLLTNFLSYPLFSYVLILQPNHEMSYPTEWRVVTMSPERHQAYALQWFAFAFTLLVILLILNFKSNSRV